MNSLQYQNQYFCDRCSKFWEQVSNAMDDSKCPTCQDRCQPYRSLPYLQGFHAMTTQSEYGSFIVTWVELRLIHDIKQFLDKHSEIVFDGTVSMQLFNEQFSMVSKRDGKYLVVSCSDNTPFHEYDLEDNTAICVYDLIWILGQIEQRQTWS